MFVCMYLYWIKKHSLECSCTAKMWNKVLGNAQQYSLSHLMYTFFILKYAYRQFCCIWNTYTVANNALLCVRLQPAETHIYRRVFIHTNIHTYTDTHIQRDHTTKQSNQQIYLYMYTYIHVHARLSHHWSRWHSELAQTECVRNFSVEEALSYTRWCVCSCQNIVWFFSCNQLTDQNG